jgi:glycosyltransferase involved in cell wall biosynthesis
MTEPYPALLSAIISDEVATMPEVEPNLNEPTLDVSVIIPALNVADTIGLQLESLSRQDFDGTWEVIVADNGSTDNTRSEVASFNDRLPTLRLVDASGRRGINHARNRGAAAASGAMLLFCDGDDTVCSAWVKSMTNVLREYEAVGGRVQRTTFGTSGSNEPTVLSILDPAASKGNYLPHPLGANCGVRRSVYRELGGFNEDYDRGAADEVEFFWRVQLAGYRLGSAEDAIVHYRVPARPNLRRSFRAGREQIRLKHDFVKHGYHGASVGAVRA